MDTRTKVGRVSSHLDACRGIPRVPSQLTTSFLQETFHASLFRVVRSVTSLRLAPLISSPALPSSPASGLMAQRCTAERPELIGMVSKFAEVRISSGSRSVVNTNGSLRSMNHEILRKVAAKHTSSLRRASCVAMRSSFVIRRIAAF